MANTREQNMAITTIDKNLAVNAGAGTGKTKVLTERFIYILQKGNLEKGKEIESIVAITFTNKASQEMKERIREEIKKRFPLGREWRRYYKDMEKANISTIHSFCGNILRENALKAGIDPMFKVLDEREGELLLEETILALLLQGIEEDENIYNMVRLFNRDDLDKIGEEIKSIYYKIRTVGYSFEEVRDMTLSYIHSIKLDPNLIQYIKDTFIYLIDNSRKGSKIKKLQADPIWESFYKGTYSDKDLVSILEYLRDNIGTNSKEKERIEALNAAINKALLIKEREYEWLYETVLNLLIYIDREYSQKKDELGMLDYDDLQILVLKLLEDESIRREYQDRYKYIMVDEFQDTNEVQKRIFYSLCSAKEKLDRGNLFIVGDPKQSIYGFRGADLQVFYDVMEDIEEISGQKAITLDKNFRTVDTVLNFINSIFSSLMEKNYTSLKNFHTSNNDIDVEILEKEDLEIPPNVDRNEYYTYYESRLIASRIKELVEAGTFKYGDFALLFRATTLDYVYEEALKEFGIPYYNLAGKGFYQSQEIVDLMNGLKAISNRYDTISILGFLRSPMVGLSDRTIYWLLRHRKKDMLKTLYEDIPYIGEEEKVKIEKAKKILNELIEKKDLYGVHQLLRELIDKTYYLEALLLHQNGKQMVSNVYKFTELAEDFHRNYTGSLEDFIDYITREKATQESQAKIQSEDADVVKLMTIHKSKGLQFPVVVIPQMARAFNYQQPYGLLDKNRGLGLKYDKVSPFYDQIKEETKDKEYEENKRILYVAMTRAEKRLIIGNQGRDSGFKKMIKDLLDLEQVKIIEEISAERNYHEPVKVLDQKLFKRKALNREAFPLLIDMEGYNQKIFPSFSASQFIDFKQCRRRFFMNYYERVSIDFPLNRELEGKEDTSLKLDPIIKGNMVHKFCQYYKEGMEKEKLLKQIVSSFGIEYDKEIERELSPYIENYLKYHREDYDQIHKEKEFYLKIEDAYLYGIIDRVNIKNGAAEILDFKTNRVHNKYELLEYYQPQLQLYTYAFKKITNMKVKRAAILFLETGHLEEIDISERSLQKIYEELEEFVNFVNKNNSIHQYSKGDSCKGNCKYSILCNLH